jgi:hypothetical protein
MSTNKIRREITAVRDLLVASIPLCPGVIEFREGTEAELAAWPDAPAECPLCGRVHAREGIAFIEVVKTYEV